MVTFTVRFSNDQNFSSGIPLSEFTYQYDSTADNGDTIYVYEVEEQYSDKFERALENSACVVSFSRP